MRSHLLRHRRPLLLLPAALLILPLLTASPAVAGTPASVTVGVGGAAPTSATYAGPALVGTDDGAGLAGQSAATCTAVACDRETVVLAAPAGYTATHVVGLSASVTATDAASTFDIGIFDNNGTLLASNTAGTSPTSVGVGDVQPGTYIVQVDGDVAAGGGFNGVVKTSTATRSQLAGLPDGGISASRETVADPFRLGTEPDVVVSPDGTTYESPIFGFSTTQSFLERSDDGGQTFHTLGAPGSGKLVATPQPVCTGGGDSDTAVDPFNDLYFIDLGGEPSVPAYVSHDHGLSFTSDCEANDQNGANVFTDRQWLSTDTVHGYEWYIYRDGLLSATAPAPLDSFSGNLYGEYIKYAPLATSAGTAGSAQLAFTSLCKPNGIDAACVLDVATAGNAITDNYGPKKGNTYLAEKTPAGVGVVVINPTANPTVKEYVASAGANNILFPTVAVDRAGNVYEAWADAATYQVMFSRSMDQGKTWSKPVAINGAPAKVNVMPWLVAGDSGRVDVAFYGSANAADPTTNYGPWNLYMAQTLNGTDAIPTWSQAVMTDRPNHVDPICLSGLGCTTNMGPAGDRELGDFFKIALDSTGRAVISFADGNNLLGAEVVNGPLASPSFANYVRQATGPSLFASQVDVPAIAVPTKFVTVGAHDVHVPYDVPAGPAATQGPTNDALNIFSSSIRYDAGSLKIELQVKNLDPTVAITPPALPVATYMTRWWYKGQVYYAAAEDSGGQWSFFSGQIAPVTDGLAIKYSYYPATNTDTGSVRTGANGTIDISVPTSEVGGPPDNSNLFSITSSTWSHALPSASTPPTASNYTDIPEIIDVLPAYNYARSVVPTAPTPAPTTAPSASPTPPPTTPPLPNTAAPAPFGPPLAVLMAVLLGFLARRRRGRGGLPRARPQH
ncbi:MAG: sialidase family protein [Candidatus Dormibacteria bacterium]